MRVVKLLPYSSYFYTSFGEFLHNIFSSYFNQLILYYVVL